MLNKSFFPKSLSTTCTNYTVFINYDMITVNKKNLTFVGFDYYCRPVWKLLHKETYFKDVNCSDNLKEVPKEIPDKLHLSHNDFDGEPDTLVYVVDK